MGMPRRITRAIGALAFGLAALTATDAHAAETDGARITTVVQQDSGFVSLRTKEERTKEERTKEERTKEE